MPIDRPNILVIWGDDIGITNLSCYSDGLMGYRTPNIDRIANEGSYGEQSCTAGRAAFISGQSDATGQFGKNHFGNLYELALPRGALKCRATDEVSSEPDDPKFGPVGKQVIEDTGALDTKRMETIDAEATGACVDYGAAILETFKEFRHATSPPASPSTTQSRHCRNS
jgi:hypothetical protein